MHTGGRPSGEARKPPDRNDPAVRRFLTRFRIDPDALPRDRLLRTVLRAFSHLPYENLTKILKDAAPGGPTRREPEEVLLDHFRYGTGGTCFSLVATLRHILLGLGFDATPILADRTYGPDTHCALIVRLDDQPVLADPGYLLAEPLPLDGPEERRIVTPFHEIRLVPRTETGRMELYTGGNRQPCMSFKPETIGMSSFLSKYKMAS